MREEEQVMFSSERYSGVGMGLGDQGEKPKFPIWVRGRGVQIEVREGVFTWASQRAQR